MNGELRLDWCSHEAAKYAVLRWHYSRAMPAGKLVKVGVWEAGQFIGVVVFSRGANPRLGHKFGLTQTEVCELTRVALTTHRTATTRILSIAIRMLRQQSPGLKLIFSYADCDQNHHGGIYAGGNWIYLGKVQLNGGTPCWMIHGRKRHCRTVTARGWTPNREWLRRHVDPHAEPIYTTGKHKYVFPLTSELAAQLKPLAQPYPKRGGGVTESTTGDQPVGDGSIPIPPL